MILQHYFELFRHYRRMVVTITLSVGLAAVSFSVFFLLKMPAYTATASVTILPTQDELSFSRRFVREGSGVGNPSDVMMQTHIEYLLSRPNVEKTLHQLTEQMEKSDEEEPRLHPVEWMMDQLQAGYRFINYGTTAQASEHDIAIRNLRRAIDVRVVEGSYIMQISAAASTPDAAANIANTIAHAYATQSRAMSSEAAAEVTNHLRQEISRYQNQLDPEVARELRNRLIEFELWRSSSPDQVRVIDPAVPPAHPSFPRVVPATITGFVFGGLLSLLLVIVLDTFGNTARTSTDMNRIVGKRYLGLVPDALATLVTTHGGRVPLSKVAPFAVPAAARMGLFEVMGQHWIHVAGLGGEAATANKAGVAVAAAYANSGLPVELVLEDHQRYRVSRTADQLEMVALPAASTFSAAAVVTVGTMPEQRPALLTNGREDVAEDGFMNVKERTDVTADNTLLHAPVILAVSVGQVHEDLLSMLALTGAQRMFVLVP
jgi:capsular polysaccharide biosynthesis protein